MIVCTVDTHTVMSGDIYYKCGHHGYFAKKCRSSSRSVNIVDDSDTEDIFLGYIDTEIKTLNTE